MSQTKVEAPFVQNSRPFRNLIINGDMQVAQRATSTSGVANDANEGYNSLDRFGLYYYGNEGGAATMSQDTTVPSDTSYGVQRQSLKVDVTTADASIGTTGIIALKHTVEAQYIHHSGWDYTSSSANITLSFWARSVKAGTYCVLFRCHDASGERYYVKEYTLVANTWKHIICTVPGDSNLVFNADNGEGFEIRWILACGNDRNDATANTWFAPGSDYDNSTSNQVNFYDHTDNNFFLTGVQLEVGDTATDFEHLPFDVQRQRCYRYCQRHPDLDHSVAYAAIGHGWVQSTTAQSIQVAPHTVMRTVPSVAQTGNLRIHSAGGGGDATTAIAVSAQITTASQIYLATTTDSGSGLTQGEGTFLQLNNDADAFLIFSAEL